MTTHDMQPEMTDREPQADAAAPVADRPIAEPSATEQPLESADATPDFEASAQPAMAEPAAPTQPAMAEPSTPAHAAESTAAGDQTLFDDGELSDLKSRWTEVQAEFVDAPRDCVQKADGLVSDVVDRLTAGFAQARSGLEEQWSRGEQVSTEDLRVALQRYRDFFERLLAV